jgi:hypothetical protein
MTTMPEPTSARVVRFLGLSAVTETVNGDDARFPLGILYPYSADLDRVFTAFDAVFDQRPDAAASLLGETSELVGPLTPVEARAVAAYVVSVGHLQRRIGFAPGAAGRSVGVAYGRLSDTLSPTATGSATAR